MRVLGAVVLVAILAVEIGAAQSRGTMPAPAAAQGLVCGDTPPNPPPTGRGSEPIFPPGQYPVKLPAKSLLGAPNDLPNPYQSGIEFGQLPPGRKWGATASVWTAPDNTIWVADRCGNPGAGGDVCGGFGGVGPAHASTGSA